MSKETTTPASCQTAVSGSACLHDFVIKFGEYECQNCGILHEDIFNQKNIVANLVKDNKSCDKPCSPSDWYKGGKCDINGCYYE